MRWEQKFSRGARRRIGLVTVVLCAAISNPATARTITVNNNGPADFTMIQAAIDDANDGDVVIVQPCTYTGDGNRDIDFWGKAITVRSTDPNNPDVVTSTIVDCNGQWQDPHCGFIFSSGEGLDSVLSGLTIRNGYGWPFEEDDPYFTIGGGIICWEAGPTIEYCQIESCIASYGAGIYCQLSDSLINHCVIVENRLEGFECMGGGIYCENSSLTISYCEIAQNKDFMGLAQFGIGGGIYCKGTGIVHISNCFIHDNEVYLGGAAIACGSAQISNCTITNNWGGWGRAIETGANTNIVNSIIWNHAGGYDPWDPNFIYCEISNDVYVTYCDVKGGYPGEGNIEIDPLLTEDGHVRYDSYVYNAGDPSYSPTPGETDMDGQPRVMDGRIDMGIDEFNRPHVPIFAVSQEEFNLSIDCGANPQYLKLMIWNRGFGVLHWSISEDASWLSVYPLVGQSVGEADEVMISIDVAELYPGFYEAKVKIEAEGIINSPTIIPIHLHVLDADHILRVPSEYPTIQDAIDISVSGRDTVVISDGIYKGRGNGGIFFNGKAITVRSENGPHSCIIDCENTGFYFNPEDTHSVLEGLTIRNGKSRGIYSWWSNPRIYNCVVSGCGSGGIYLEGGKSIISNCIITDNSTSSDGGGIAWFYCDVTIEGCIISNNIAYRADRWDSEGGGIYGDGGTASISNCMIEGNLAKSSGGGIYLGGVTCKILDTTIIANTATEGGGIDGGRAIVDGCAISGNKSTDNGAGISGWNLNISNSVLTGNLAGGNGGALYCSGLTEVENCTLSSNHANIGGGICSDANYSSKYDIKNTILWDNTAQYAGSQIALLAKRSLAIAYSNFHNSPESFYVEGASQLNLGQGNIDVDPLFAQPGDWDANEPTRDTNDYFWINGDYHLKSQAGRWDPKSSSWIFDNVTSPCIDTGDPKSDWMTELWPHGKCINMGAYGGTVQASMSLSNAGNVADLNNDGLVNADDLQMLVEKWLTKDMPAAEDINRDSVVNFSDYAELLQNWLWEE